MCYLCPVARCACLRPVSCVDLALAESPKPDANLRTQLCASFLNEKLGQAEERITLSCYDLVALQSRTGESVQKHLRRFRLGFHCNGLLGRAAHRQIAVALAMSGRAAPQGTGPAPGTVGASPNEIAPGFPPPMMLLVSRLHCRRCAFPFALPTLAGEFPWSHGGRGWGEARGSAIRRARGGTRLGPPRPLQQAARRDVQPSAGPRSKPSKPHDGQWRPNSTEPPALGCVCP